MSISNPNIFEIILHDIVGKLFLKKHYASYIDTLDMNDVGMLMDYGSGPGLAARILAEKLSPNNGTLACVDVSEAWVKKARKNLKSFENVLFYHGEIGELAIEHGTYDAIFIHFVLHDINERFRQNTIMLLSSILKNNGKIFIREPLKEDHGMSAEEIRHIMNRSGLREITYREDDIPHMGKAFAGTYVKQPMM